MRHEDRGLKTIRMLAVVPAGAFSVHYSKDSEVWAPGDVDDALTLDDARKLASARRGLGYKTKIIEKRSGTELM